MAGNLFIKRGVLDDWFDSCGACGPFTPKMGGEYSYLDWGVLDKRGSKPAGWKLTHTFKSGLMLALNGVHVYLKKRGLCIPCMRRVLR